LHLIISTTFHFSIKQQKLRHIQKSVRTTTKVVKISPAQEKSVLLLQTRKELCFVVYLRAHRDPEKCWNRNHRCWSWTIWAWRSQRTRSI